MDNENQRSVDAQHVAINKLLNEYVDSRDAFWDVVAGGHNAAEESSGSEVIRKLFELDNHRPVLTVVYRQVIPARGGELLATEKSIVDEVFKEVGYHVAIRNAILKIADMYKASVVDMIIRADGIYLYRTSDRVEHFVSRLSDSYKLLIKLLLDNHGSKYVLIESDLINRGFIESVNLEPVSLEVATHFLRRGFV